ncbi:hypothetical protein BA6E_104159 [Bacteroidales bacterium 6E]|nr:hypothetical protein BA6E_104159 [Bacteroidales bacterium 6E]
MRIINSIAILLLILISSCHKDELSNDNNFFKITTSDSKIFRTEYVNQPVPTQNGTFSMQYNKPSLDNKLHKYFFLILIDNGSDAYLLFQNKELPIPGVKYTHINSDYLDFGLTISSQELQTWRTELNFERIDEYPGRIIGVLKSFDSKNNLICTGEFNFQTSK